MFVEKVYNNNVVLSKDHSGQEIIVMGRGLAFQKKIGDPIDQKLVEKIFTQINQEMTSRLISLLSEVPLEYFNLSEEIIQETKVRLGRKINENIILSLTDHIYFAIKRLKEGIVVKNGLLWETKRLYPEEYDLGKRAVKRINERYTINLPDDEAAFIALHLINAQLNEEIPTIMAMTTLMKGVLEIVRMHFLIEFDEESLSYYRFISHLKFFSQRLITGNLYQDENDNDLFAFVKLKYPESYKCTEKICHYIQNEFSYKLTSEEMLYITVHIQRLIKTK